MKRFGFVFGFLLLVGTARAQSVGTVTVAWTLSAATNIVSQTISYGVSTGSYTNSTVLPATLTQFQLTNLVQGVTYFINVKCADTHGLSSSYDGEVSYLVPFSPPPPPTALRVIGP